MPRQYHRAPGRPIQRRRSEGERDVDFIAAVRECGLRVRGLAAVGAFIGLVTVLPAIFR
jgi:hypothetical protein